MKTSNLSSNTHQFYLGLMSGTSCDGVDIACLKIDAESFELEFFQSFPYPESLKNRLLDCAVEDVLDIHAVKKLEIELTYFYAEKVNQALIENDISSTQINALALHGQTIRHQPEGEFPYSWQLGDAVCLSVKTGIEVISHFRQSDIANGGQGAPLAPIFHKRLLQEPISCSDIGVATANEIVLNLGGIANVTLSYEDGRLVAFDTGTANTLLDAWIRKKNLHPQGFDQGGNLAKQGKINTKLLANLLDEPYFSQQPPKSTGRELFNISWLEAKIEACGEDVKDVDLLATLVEFSAISIVSSLPALKWDYLWLCGGGANNAFFVGRIEKNLRKKCPKIKISSIFQRINMPVQAIEASAWAWLGYLYRQNVAFDLQSITGSKKPSILGQLSKP
jgi:anhydro-N-acetylmuramic acid kinase